MNSYLVRALARNKKVVVYACNTTNLVETARQKHDLWPIATAALGRTMTASLILAAKQKDSRFITIKINGNGPLGNIIVSANNEGQVRGFVTNPHVQIPSKNGKLAVGEAVGRDGTLTVIKNDFTGETPLLSGEIAEDFACYYNMSEQIPTVVSLGVLVDVDNSVINAGGFVIELLPDHTEEDIIYIENKIKDFPHISSLFKQGNSVEQIIDLLFDDATILEKQELNFICFCSKEKVKESLKLLPENDLKEMINENETIELHCDFCSTNYLVGIDELKNILEAKTNEQSN